MSDRSKIVLAATCSVIGYAISVKEAGMLWTHRHQDNVVIQENRRTDHVYNGTQSTFLSGEAATAPQGPLPFEILYPPGVVREAPARAWSPFSKPYAKIKVQSSISLSQLGYDRNNSE